MADPSDTPLWTMLRREVGEPVPDDVRAAALAALSWRDPDAELAALVLDSADPRTVAAAGVRDAGQVRLLSFAAGALVIDVEVSYPGESAHLIGQLAPPAPLDVAVDHRTGVLTARADELGRFQVGGVEPGPVRLRVAPAEAPPVHTAWVLL